jgi:ABC-type proline/glycine betaine transport system permease subunit
MAGDSRTLKLSILADVDNLTKNLNKASTETQSFGNKLGDFGKKAGMAFAVAGAAAAAYAGKLLVDGVKSAIEDEKAQAKLAATLTNVTGATDKQIAAVEAQILKTSLLTGKTDDELRPSFERLVRATKDSSEALKLQQLALDVSAGSGKSLEAVSTALGKAVEGNTAGLGKLGIGLSAAQLKTMSMDEITQALAETFKGQASKQADTFAGKMDRLKVAFAEGKETVGSFVLDAITPMVSLFVDKAIPMISDMAAKLGDSLGPAFSKIFDFIKIYIIPVINEWWTLMTTIVIPGIIKTVSPIIEGLANMFGKIAKAVFDNKEKLEPLYDLFKTVASFIYKTLGPIVGEVLGGAFKVLGTVISGLIGLFATFIDKLNSIYQAIVKIIGKIKDALGAVGGFLGMDSASFESNSMSSVPNLGTGNGYTGQVGLGANYNITVNGAIDSESTARQIVEIMNDSRARGTLGSAGFAV